MTSSFDNLRTAATRRDKRMEALFTALLRLPGYLSEWGMSKDARETARSLCEFFDSESDRHRNEQEARLFPALLASVQDRDSATMRDRVATFTADHRALEHAWKKLRPRLAAIGFGRPARLAIDEAAQFATLYRNHVADEHRQLFAAAFGAEHPSTDRPSK
jgi:hemerythrin-like domain-containing protein